MKSDRKNVSNVEKEVDGGITMIETYVEALKIEIKTRTHLLTVLEQAEAFYHHERGEVKVVANVRHIYNVFAFFQQFFIIFEKSFI